MRPPVRHLLVAALVIAPPAAIAAAQDVPSGRVATTPVTAFVSEAARRFGLPEGWIWAVIRVESRSDPHAVSPAGAMGLMQVMPATWAAMRARYGLGGDPFDAHDNIVAGAAYLRILHDRYGDPAAMLAAYNAGPARYDDWIVRRRPLPTETVAYLAQLGDVTGGTTGSKAAPDPLAWTRAPLFISTGMASATAQTPPPGNASTTPVTTFAAADNVQQDALFVARAKAGPTP